MNWLRACFFVCFLYNATIHHVLLKVVFYSDSDISSRIILVVRTFILTYIFLNALADEVKFENCLWKQYESGRVIHGKSFTVSQVYPYTEEAWRQNGSFWKPRLMEQRSSHCFLPSPEVLLLLLDHAGGCGPSPHSQSRPRSLLFCDLTFRQTTLLEERD